MMLQKFAPVLRTVVRRSSLWRPPHGGWGRWAASPIENVFDRMERDFRDMEREFGRFWNWKPFISFDEAPSVKERFYWAQPIVEEDGKKKFKLLFDVSHFSPQEIEVKTSKGKLTVHAKHQSKNEGRETKYEYLREYSIPEGVKLDEMTCKYTDEGALVVEAPYTPPVEPPKEQAIPIKHE